MSTITDRKAEEIRREKRRQIIAANLMAGLSYRDIQAAFAQRGESVSIGTISNDAKVILGRLQREQIQDTDQWVSMELRRLDVAFNAIWTKVRDGHLGAIDRMLAIMNKRAKLLGLDQPVEVKVNDDGLLSDTERADRISQLLDAARARRARSDPGE